ncbi:MAG: tungstate ABC transporter substrate-binding protein WtpA [Bacteroidales bacterium]|nr:tungstate ABC transporter substrate-binding protein WtpA [Bacteroidales bacterium]
MRNRTIKNANRLSVLFFSLALFLLSSCAEKKEKEIIIFHAGSLSLPMKDASREYMELNPDVNILLEGAGSVACARKITELNKPCDIMASADYKVIEKFLMPGYTDWNIWFATNEIVIAYNERSESSDIINAGNWYEILADKDVVYGRADPNADPCGYRSVMMFRLAERYYEKEGLADGLISKDRNMIRPKEVDLVALLETGALDYIIQYKSVCEQHGLDYISLPAEINLSDPASEDLYNSVSVEITGESPGKTISIRGSSMIYGISMPYDAPNREAATAFLEYFLGEKGRAVLEANGQSPLELQLSGAAKSLPEKLRAFFD